MMSARTHTHRPFYRNAAEVLALARDLAAPARLQAFLTALRARHPRNGFIPVPDNQPIAPPLE